MLFFTYGVMFYAYGVYLHCGYELSWPDAHHPWINSSYQHYLHHTKSTAFRSYYTGFFVKIWDQLIGTVWTEADGPCFCAKCEREKGNRSRDAWEKVSIPDYSVLASLSFWLKDQRQSAKQM